MGFRNVEAEGAKAFYLFKDRMPGEAIAFACAAVSLIPLPEPRGGRELTSSRRLMSV